MSTGRIGKKKIESYDHPSSSRVNNPSAESVRFMDEEDVTPCSDQTSEDTGERETAPIRLTWDRGTMPPIPVAPLFVHEKISPHKFMESLTPDPSLEQLDMHSIFNGLPPEAPYEWYRHQGNWSNRLIKGEAVHVMQSLLHKEGMQGQIQCIYMDPPYNISYRSNFLVQTNNLEVPNGAEGVSPDPQTIRTFRDNYVNDTHSFLDQLQQQFELCRTLLSDSGSIFVQIGPNRVHDLAILLREVFGEECHVSTIPFRTGTTSSKAISEIGNWILWYAKNRDAMKYNQLYGQRGRASVIELFSSSASLRFPSGETRKVSEAERKNPSLIPEDARLFSDLTLLSSGHSSTGRSESFEHDSEVYLCPPGKQWCVSHEGLASLAKQNRLVFKGGTVRWIKYEDEVPGRKLDSMWRDTAGARNKVYPVQTPPLVVERCILMTTDPGDLVFDPTCGSGVTALSSERWGRRWIACDVQPTAIAIARQRLLCATHPYYVLQDSAEGADKEAEKSGTRFDSALSYGHDPAQGFIYERVPKVSARTLAYEHREWIFLTDRPLEKRSVTRVSSPFTVESRSPYRVAPLASEESFSVEGEHSGFDPTSIVWERIEAALVKSGIHARSGERWHSQNWREIPGEIALHTCDLTLMPSSDPVSAAVMLAEPEETVSELMIRNSASRVRQVLDVQMLVVVGFSFEGLATQAAKAQFSIGRLDVRCVKASHDLLIEGLSHGSEDRALVLLSEPDVAVRQVSNSKDDTPMFEVEVLGLDVYDPNSGQIEGKEVSEIDCIMVDTAYNESAFFAHLINIPQKGMSGDNVERMRQVLGASISEEKWATMRTATTLPFPLPEKPELRKIAIKVVDNTGMEHMTVRDYPA